MTAPTTAIKWHSESAASKALLWGVAVVLLFYKLGDTTPWQSEDRWLQIGNEMLRSGNIFAPTINGQLYFDKPLLSYWLELIAAIPAGGFGELAMRLPSALAGLLVIAAIMSLARALWSDRVAVLAGWVTVTSFGFLQWARLGEADMENLAATIGAVAWYWQHRQARDYKAYFVFYLIAAIGAQCKGLGAIVVPLLAVTADIAQEKRWRQHLNLNHALAIFSAAVIYFVPFWLSAHGEHATPSAQGSAGLQQVLRENIVRYVAPFDHTGPVYTYLIAIPQYLFPWSPILIAALISAIRSRKTKSESNWILLCIALIFTFFTLSGSRRNYYILPILPYCTLLIAHYLDQARDSVMKRWSIGLSVCLMLTIVALQATLPLYWSALEKLAHAPLPDEFRHSIFITGLIAALTLLWMFIRYRYRRHFGITTVTALAVIVWSGFFFSQQIYLDHYRSEADFAVKLRTLLQTHGSADAAIFREKPEGKLLFYANFAAPLHILQSPDELREYISTPPYPKWVLAYRKYANMLPPALQQSTPVLIESQFPWEKANGEKMQAWLITTPRDGF